jgi:hypothetical protein
MKKMKVLFGVGRRLAVIAIILIPTSFRPPSFTMQDFHKLKSIQGLWVTKRANGDIYEQWARADSSRFVGKSYRVVKSDTLVLETMSLYYQQEEIVFAPVAAGQNDEKQVFFKLKSIEGAAFTFENLAHDFPQRIVYNIKSENILHAYIEGQMEAKKKRIDYPYTRIH